MYVHVSVCVSVGMCVCVLIHDADALVDVCYIDLKGCDIFLCVYVYK